MIKIFKSNFFLIIITIIFLLIYLFHLSKNKGVVVVKENEIIKKKSLKSTNFYNVEYIIKDKNKKTYTVKGEEAKILNDNADIIFLDMVSVYSKLNNGTTIKINSNNAKFFKYKKDIFFENNIIFTNKDMTIKADRANFFYDKDVIELFDNIVFKDNKNIIKCDKAIYNIVSKNIQLEMYSQKNQVYGKR